MTVGRGHGARRGDVVAVLVVGAVVFAVYSFWPRVATAVGLAPSETVLADGPVALDAASALAAALVVVLVTRRLPATERRSWRLVAAGVAAWGLGSAFWLGCYLAEREPPLPGPQDVAYLALPVLLLVAVLRYPAERRRPRGAVHLVDAMLTATATLLILWVGALRWAVGGDGTDLVASTVNLAYPLADVVVIMLLTDLLRRVRPERRAPLALLCVGVGLATVSDVLYLVLEAYGTYESSALATDAGWAAGWAVVAGAAVVVARGPRPAAAAAPLRDQGVLHVPDDEAEHLASRPVPLVAALVALVLALLVMAARPADVPWTVPLTVVVLGLLLTRQSLTLHQNRGLADRLAASVRDLAHAADHDGLTGLHNRVGLEARILDAVGTSPPSGSITAVAFVDIDHLKTVNDSLGHAAGDRLITWTAEHLRDAGVGDVTRFGGDEFVVVMGGMRPDALGAAISGLVTAGSRSVHLDEGELRASISVGVAVAAPGVGPRELLRRADVALYRAKQTGRNRASFYEPSMDADTRRHLVLEPELRSALERDEFVLHYQPVVDAASGRLQGAEALLRWQHPTRGLLGPDRFLEDADALGLLGEIGRRSLARATRDFAALAVAPGSDPLRVAVNLSASELTDGHAVDRVRRCLAEADLAASSLVLEIREDVVVDETTRRTIDELAAGGVELAIDDFGTGNSSLRQLGTYPAAVLKIDRSFIDGLGTEPEDTFVVRAVLNLAHNLGLRTVAEGVETETQLRLLVELGCDSAQGWLFGRPVAFDEFVARYVRAPMRDRTDEPASSTPRR